MSHNYKDNQTVRPDKSNRPYDRSGKTAAHRMKKPGTSWLDYCPRVLRERLAKNAAAGTDNVATTTA